eukprot:scaffold325300_cov66-Tisochrysis_lutea.AAC.7
MPSSRKRRKRHASIILCCLLPLGAQHTAARGRYLNQLFAIDSAHSARRSTAHAWAARERRG